MTVVTRSRQALLVVAAIVALIACWAIWRPRAVSAPTTRTPPSSTATPTSQDDSTPTTLYAHNLRLIKGPNFRVYIRWIRGEMLRTKPGVNPSFDDPESFVLDIKKGVIRANIGDISNYLNGASPAGAPLRNISIQPDGNQLKLHGTVRKLLVPLPVELTGQLAPLPDGRVDFHVSKISLLKIPLKGLLGTLHLQLSDLVHASNIPGVQVSDNDVLFDTRALLPPPHIRGQITSITVRPPDLEVIYGNAGNHEESLSQWHNFFRLQGGTLDFGKLTMHHVDLTLIDASQDPWFDLDLVNYQAQLVNGYTRMTPQAGLEIFMPDVDEQAPKKSSQAITLEWLKNRNQSLPPDVPVK